MAYVDPRKYPQTFETQLGWAISLGVYPSEDGYSAADNLTTLGKHLDANPTLPLGPIGLDWRTASPIERDEQRGIFRKMLLYASLHRPLINSLRSAAWENPDLIYFPALKDVQEHCGSTQPMHVRAFTGSNSMVRNWIHFFPNNYVNVVVGKRPQTQQVETLKEVLGERLLLESAGPVMSGAGEIGFFSPFLSGEIGTYMITWLDMDIELVAILGSNRGQRLFNLV
ncbi:uncharacterized protein [Procambarus clarkii]|uniref:uncharacterized protein n=1 Tax=Procambarus clarkii TaxID=6728 RepID=UPI00374324CA